MRCNSGIVIDDQTPYVTERYKSHIYLGNPHNCLQVLSAYNFDEVIIINKSTSLTNANLMWYAELAANSSLPLAFTGNIESIDQAIYLIRHGYERIFVQSLFLRDPLAIRRLAELVGRQAIGVKIDLCFDASLDLSVARNHYDVGDIKELLRCNQEYFSEVLVQNTEADGLVCGAKEIMHLLKAYRFEKTLLSYCGGVVSKQDVELLRLSGWIDGVFMLRTPATSPNSKEKLPNDFLA